MNSRLSTRTTRSSSIMGGINKTKNVLGGISNNENIIGLPGKAKITTKRGLGVKDSNKMNCENQSSHGGLKRKAEAFLESSVTTKKRSVLGDVTNAIEKTISNGRKEVQKLGGKKTRVESVTNKQTVSSMAKQSVSSMAKQSVSTMAKQTKNKRTLSAATGKLASVTVLPKVKSTLDDQLISDMSYCDALPSSQEVNNKTTLDSSNYLTASEESSVSSGSLSHILEEVEVKEEKVRCHVWPPVPEGVVDYDKECEMDPFAVAIYANDIFKYYKGREGKFIIPKYLDTQPEISVSMRAILVDWMVEVQESFELNHETLYLAVKIVDLYLSKVVIARDKLQLVGSTALFIACKFDERVPPYVDDFLFICDDAYKRDELLDFEREVLKKIGFDLGIPLSYRYLRRYARCSKVSMEELTLARYILELSLMEYDVIDASDHCLAAAALFLSRYISHPSDPSPWTPTLQHYSGLNAGDLMHLVHSLHSMLIAPHKEHLKTIRNKYSHEVFYKVAKVPVPEELSL